MTSGSDITENNETPLCWIIALKIDLIKLQAEFINNFS